VTARRAYTPRGEGFRKDGDRPRGDRPFSVRGRRVTAIAPAATGPSGTLAAIRNSPAVRPDRGPRKNFGSRPDGGGIATPRNRGDSNRGRSARIAASAIPVPPATAPGTSTSRASTSPVTTSRAKIARQATARSASVRNSIAPGKIAATVPNSIVRVSVPKAARWQDIRAASRAKIARAAKTGTTAGFLPSVRRSAAVAPTASASPSSTSARRVRRAKRNPASVSPRWCRGLALPRAATRRVDYAGPRQRQWPRHQFAGARCHRQRRHHRRW